MFRDPAGRLARTTEDAEAFIFKFIAENQCCPDQKVHDRSHGYDLYLPWLLEIVENIHVDDAERPLTVSELDELYMEAGWSLVTKGFLRPGTRRVTGENSRDGYGKGYALTRQGMDRVGMERVEAATSEP